MRAKKYIYISFLSIFALLATFGSVYAADFRVADKDSGNVHVEQGEPVKNLYAAGGAVSVDANVQKSLYAAGGMVTINGSVEGSLFSGAGNLSVNGDVGGSLHAGGGSVIVNGKVGDDLIIGGGNIVISKSSSVGGDLVIGGGVVDLQAPVSGDVYMGGGVITINSEINGNVKITSADKIKLGSNAKINGNLSYASKNEIEIADGAVVAGETTILENKFAGSRPDKGTMLAIVLAIVSVVTLIKVGGFIIVGLLLAYLFKNTTEEVVKESVTNFWKSLGIGFIFLVVVPVAVVVLFITLVGIWLGVIALMLYVLAIMFASTLASITFGSWAWSVIKKNKDYKVDWKIVVGGVVAMAVIRFIPVIGGFACLVFMLISLGAICTRAYKAIKS